MDPTKLQQIYQTFHPLFYGVKVRVQQKELDRQVILKLNDTNFAFLELLSESLKVVMSICIYDILGAYETFHIGGSLQELEIRLKDYRQNFYLITENSNETRQLQEILNQMIQLAHSQPWAEYSVKNLIRKILNNSDIANIGNYFKLDDLDNMLYFLRIKLQQEEKNKLIKKTIQNPESLNQYDFRRVFKVLLLKEELSLIFKKLLDIGEYEKIGKLTITLDILLQWLRENQQEQIEDEQEIKNFFLQIKNPNLFLNEIEQSSQRFLNEDEKMNFHINFEEFFVFVFSPLNSINQKPQKNLNLEQPLSHYYINSSFNTMIWGDILYGQVSIENYKRAIERGCRFIQLNIFDGFDGPVISKQNNSQEYIYLETLFIYISKNVFLNTQTPMILHLFLNCNESNRITVAELINKHLGSQIYLLSKDSFQKNTLPPLSDFMNKILIFSRTAYPNYSNKKKKQNQEPLTWYTSFFSESYNEGGLNTIFGFCSLSEGRLKEMSRNLVTGNALIDFNKQYINLTYPDLIREDSSNFDPLISWNKGIQITALNQQNQDIINMYNKAMFSQYPEQGFQLKPNCFLKEQIQIEQENPVLQISIRIVSSQLQMMFIDENDYIFNFVEMQVKGTEKDTLSNPIYKSKVYQNNFFHSIYTENEKEVQIWNIFNPQLAFIEIQIKNAKTSNTLKSNVIKISDIRQGLRSISLYEDYLVDDKISVLLVDVKLNQLSEQLFYQNQLSKIFLNTVESSQFLLYVSHIYYELSQ